ncbi:hypothetical protein A2U01_0101528, partial [Trifolium medium]|nr:hypothetical protein [Trifolium medium]
MKLKLNLKTFQTLTGVGIKMIEEAHQGTGS